MSSDQQATPVTPVPGEQAKVLIWDLPVRVMHWGLALSVLGAWLTRELPGDWFKWHTAFGYAVLVLTVTRILWGWVGTRHARFANFVRGPRAIVAYLRGDWHPATDGRAAGHNPLGALMIVAFLAMLLAQAVSGLFANDQVLETGPLFGYVDSGTSDRLTTLHKQLFDGLLVAIVVHVAAALFYLWYRRENLILPMITGRKPAAGLAAGAPIERSRVALALLIAAAVAAVLGWLVQTAPVASLYVF